MSTKYLISLFMLFLQFNAFAKSSTFIINGKVNDTDSGFILIRNLIKPVADTVKIRKGIFTYKGKVDEPTPMVIIDEANRYQMFFAEPNAKINLTLNRKDMQVTYIDGSKAQEVFKKLINMQDPLQRQMEILQQTGNIPGANKDSLQALAMKVNNQRNENFYTFLKENGNTEVAAYIVCSSISQDRRIDATLADSMFNYLYGKGKTSFYGKETEKLINKLRAVTVGYIAPDFELPDSAGKQKHSLKSFRGKYVLVDFWASWCGPCKAEIPYMKEAYAHYKNKGFEILSVSLDDKREAWLASLRQFQMPWLQISDSKGFNSIVNDLYPIPSIPKTLLLDPSGKIIATDLRGNALDQKLEELLGKP